MRLHLLGAGILALIAAYGHLDRPDPARAMTHVPAGALPLRTVASVPLPGGSSRFDYQSLDQQRHLLFIAHLGAGLVHVVDTRSNRVVTTIHGIAGVHGILVVPRLRRVYASATDDQQVAVIDEHTFHVLARVPAGTYPDGLAYDPPDHRVFVSDESGGADIVIDTRTNHRTATISLGGEAGNTQYDPVSHRILVDVQTRNQLVAIDPATLRIVARHGLPGCDHDHGLLIDPALRLAFVACDGNARLLTVDLHTFWVLSARPVGPDPDVLAFDTGLKRVYLAAESGIVTVFREHGRSLVKLGQAFVAQEAHTIAVDSRTHRVYLPLEGTYNHPVLRIMAPQGAG